jgi:hypothetical protein
MINNNSATEQLLNRLSRQSPDINKEAFFVTSPGGRAAAWVIKVISKYDYNVYNVRTVEIGDAGTTPVVMGDQTQAVNVAESFLSQGILAANSYAIMFRVADKNVFYAPV